MIYYVWHCVQCDFEGPYRGTEAEIADDITMHAGESGGHLDGVVREVEAEAEPDPTGV